MAKDATAQATTRLKVTQVRSGIGRPRSIGALQALGLSGYQRSVVQEDTPAIRGMIFQVRHLVEVEELDGGDE